MGNYQTLESSFALHAENEIHKSIPHNESYISPYKKIIIIKLIDLLYSGFNDAGKVKLNYEESFLLSNTLRDIVSKRIKKICNISIEYYEKGDRGEFIIIIER